MKTKIFAFLLASVLISISGYSQIKSAKLTAAGLTCAMCTKAINKSLEAVSYVQSVKADIKNSAFDIRFKDGANVNLDELKKAVEDAGFSVAKLKIEADFGKAEIRNDAHVNLNGKTYHFVNVKSQTLSGENSFTVVDKNFISSKDFKKFAAATKLQCIHTGKMETCCTKEANESRIYHLTL